jgi:hypothetical protein
LFAFDIISQQKGEYSRDFDLLELTVTPLFCVIHKLVIRLLWLACASQERAAMHQQARLSAGLLMHD